MAAGLGSDVSLRSPGLPPRVWFLLAAGLSLGLFLLHFARTGFGVYGDGLGYYAQLRSLLFDGDLRVGDEFRRFAAWPGRWTAPPMEVSKFPIGLPLVLLPFFLLGHGCALLLRGLGVGVAADGLSWPYELFYCGGSLALGVAGLALCYRAAARRFGERPALAAVAGAWFASPLSYYLIIESSMSHAVSQFMVSLFLFLVLDRDWTGRLPGQLLLGMVLGLSALVRFQDGLFLVVPLALALTAGPAQGLPRRLGPVLLMVAAAGLCLLPQAALYLRHYGGASGIPYLREGAAAGLTGSFDWLHPKILPVLFSGYHGLFAWHPLMLLGTAGLAFFPRGERKMAAALLAGFGAQVWLTASWHAWHQGASMGGRMFASSTFVFTMGLAALWSAMERRGARTVPVLATVIMVAWNGVLALRYLTGLLPAGSAVGLGELFGGQFRALPVILDRVLH